MTPDIAEPDFSELFAEVSSGVVPIYAVVCGGPGSGTGFLIDPNTVVTAEHVVHGAVAASVQVDGVPYAADVIGVDVGADLAVLELRSPAAGHVLRFANADPERGDPVAALGYPDGDPLRLTEGTVAAVDKSEMIEGTMFHDLVESDATARGGNSGGPLIDKNGDVVGVLIAGQKPPGERSLAVQASTAEPTVTNPAGLHAPAHCDHQPLGPEDEAVAGLPDESAVGTEIATTVARYFVGINTGNYWQAYEQLSPRLRSGSTYEAFAHDVSTSYDYGFEVRDAQLSLARPKVTLEFVSLQAPEFGPSGESCTMWLLEYEFVRTANGRFLIDEVNPPADATAHRPCR
ncbi:serine protease [Haloechinothrix salitolerans]|uniref:S1C family serine protease n=1 Tax=Haloechinothrix salitolerans TaxID=926830 RepID=UPI0031EBD1E4